MRRKLPRFLSYSKEERYGRPVSYINREPPEAISPFVNWLAKFIITIIPSVALVVPMTIMLFHPSRIKGVVTVTSAIFLVSVFIATFTQARLSEILVSTAMYTTAYAAVLVVFVGTSA